MLPFLPIKLSVVDLNQCLNAINWLYALEEIPPESFHEFFKFEPPHQGG